MKAGFYIKLAVCSVLLWGVAVSHAWAGPSLDECNGMKNLVFVAHQDDDLLFMNPDIDQVIDAGGCVQTVYLTAAERGEGLHYMLGRARGVAAAYALMADSSDNWTETETAYGGKHQARFSLNANPRVVLVHMRIEDPWLGKGWGSLTPLSRAESIAGASAKALGSYGESYTRADLVTALAAIIADYQPTVIRHMDDSITVPYTSLCWRCIGHDHPDHIASARLVRDAIRAAPGDYAEAAYVDYPTQERGVNLTAAEIAAKTQAFKRYAEDDYQYCPNPKQCNEPAGTAAAWVGRTYYVVRQTEPPAMIVSGGNGYLLFTAGEKNSAANVLVDSDVQQADDSVWESLGGRISSGVGAFRWADGRAGVMTQDAMGQLWINSQKHDTGWQGWRSLGSMRSIRLPAVVNLGNGQPAFLLQGGAGALQYCSGATADDYAAASCRPVPFLKDLLPGVAMSLNADNLITLFAADRGGRLWVTSQNATGPQSWHPWKPLSTSIRTSGGLAAMRGGDGRMMLFWRNQKNGNMMRMTEISTRGARQTWSPPEDLGFSYVGRPSIGLNEHGNVTVAALEQTGSSLMLVEKQGLTRIGAGVMSAPALCAINNQLLLISRSNDANQKYWLWKRLAGAWQAPLLLSEPPQAGSGAYAPRLAPAVLTSAAAETPKGIAAAPSIPPVNAASESF